jgi:hypothetical protein
MLDNNNNMMMTVINLLFVVNQNLVGVVIMVNHLITYHVNPYYLKFGNMRTLFNFLFVIPYI